MTDNINDDEKAPKTDQGSSLTENKKNVRISNLLAKAIKKFDDRFDTDFKPTLGDYLKLVQLELDVEQDTAKEIKVTWVEPTAKSDD
jgi:hypothetical protein